MQMMKLNVMSLMIMTRLFLPKMIENGRGHVINISSVAGIEAYQGGSIYCATKAAVHAFTNASRHDVVGTPVRFTTITPGLVETEFSKVRFKGDEQKAKSVYDNIVPLNADDVADSLVHAATRPTRV